MNQIHAWLARTDFNGYEQIGLGLAVTAICGAGWWLSRKVFHFGRRSQAARRFEDKAVMEYLRGGLPEAVSAFCAYCLGRILVMVCGLIAVAAVGNELPSGHWVRTVLAGWLMLFTAVILRNYTRIVTAYGDHVLDPAMERVNQEAVQAPETAQAPEPEPEA